MRARVARLFRYGDGLLAWATLATIFVTGVAWFTALSISTESNASELVEYKIAQEKQRQEDRDQYAREIQSIREDTAAIRKTLEKILFRISK